MEAFNSVDYIDELVKVGVPEKQAKVQAQAFGKAIGTKKDCDLLQAKFQSDIEKAKFDVTKWVVGIGLAQVGLYLAIV